MLKKIFLSIFTIVAFVNIGFSTCINGTLANYYTKRYSCILAPDPTTGATSKYYIDWFHVIGIKEDFSDNKYNTHHVVVLFSNGKDWNIYNPSEVIDKYSQYYEFVTCNPQFLQK